MTHSFAHCRPKVVSRDGNLIFEAGDDKNITFRMKGRGSVNINDIDVLHFLRGSGNSSSGAYVNVDGVSRDLRSMRLSLFSNIIPRLRVLEDASGIGNVTRRPGRNRTTPSNGPDLTRLRRRVVQLETKVTLLMTKFTENNCASSPCVNGGTCLNMYNDFQCQCETGWQGKRCAQDVNECAIFAGTDQGCQNGATCQNTLGGYSCLCAPGYVGTHCLRRNVDCLYAQELCQHGVCVPTNDPIGYKCLCDQGWKTNGVSPACTVDIDECSESRPHCSMDPVVACENLPGSFRCGNCPLGYAGNGYYCR